MILVLLKKVVVTSLKFFDFVCCVVCLPLVPCLFIFLLETSKSNIYSDKYFIFFILNSFDYGNSIRYRRSRREGEYVYLALEFYMYLIVIIYVCLLAHSLIDLIFANSWICFISHYFVLFIEIRKTRYKDVKVVGRYFNL